MRPRYMVIGALCVVGLARGARGQNAAAMKFAEHMAGCYALDRGPWRSASVAVGDISTLRTPSRFELTAARLTGYDGLQRSDRPMFVARSFPDYGESDDLSYWQRTSLTSDTVHISSPVPLAGVYLRLTPSGKDLVGRVTAFTDAIPRDGKAEISRPVRARRIDCP